MIVKITPSFIQKMNLFCTLRLWEDCTKAHAEKNGAFWCLKLISKYMSICACMQT